MTKCSICHRPLKDPESVKRGIGPICYGNMFELAEIERVIKAAEQARKQYEELKSELAAVCKEYVSLCGGE